MALVNEQFLKLSESYLFSEIAKKVNAFKVIHPEAKVIRLGIGDVTLPLPEAVIDALHKAVDEMSVSETFKGYGPEQGYRFLIDTIIKHDYETRGISLDPDEVFINDGAKSDTGNIGDILSKDNRIAVTDPVDAGLVQSFVMSVALVVVLGFVSAGLLTLRQAVPVIFGCNIGTTVTAQLLAFRLEDMRGLVLLVGYRCSSVYYERAERIAGESHYPLSKMLALAFDGITSLSIKPIRFITGFGVFVALVSFIGVLWAVIEAALGLTVSGWASMTSIICFVSGVQLICLGVIGEYIGKIYLESKHRPRYIISDATPNFGEIKEDAQ